MYAEMEVMYPMYPYLQNFSQEVQHLEEFCEIEKTSVLMNNLVPTYSVLEYDLGDGDLFKAPEPIIEEPMIGLDPMSAAISMISCGKDVVSPQTSIQNEHLLSEFLYECEKDLIAKSTIGEQFSEVSAVHAPAMLMEDPITENDRLLSQGAIQKSVSSGGLSSMDWINGGPMRPNFLDFQGVDFGAAYGMRRAFSEGDMQALNNCNTSLNHCRFEKTLTIGNYSIEERRQRISRYRTKKTKRNFGRSIKYACRKALADSQPRVRGRFAKTEESDIPNK